MIKESIKTKLQNILGKHNVLTAPEVLKTYSYDGTQKWVHEPDVVVFPTSAEEISDIMKLANVEKTPVTPRGGGTNVSGGSVPIMGGIVLSITKMNRTLIRNQIA
ncbi:MAG: FAD-binding oxidoreductase [Thermodesulfobacteriota bacterium]